MTGTEGRGSARGAGRPITYCLIPPELAAELHERLREHFRDEEDLEVVVERRRRERRGGDNRRQVKGSPPADRERRRIKSPFGRRAGERRAPLVPLDKTSELPAAARAHASEIGFAERLEPSTERSEELDTVRVVTRIQAGADSDFSIVYRRYFDRVYAYLRLLLDDPDEAEALTRTTFDRVYEKIPSFERGGQPFRAWIFAAVRKEALRHLAEHHSVRLEDPLAQGTHLERAAVEDEELFALHWITDRDLLILVERLPPAERQVLLLRYMLALPSADVAAVLNRDGPGVRKLAQRAEGYLRDRLPDLSQPSGR